MLKVLISVVFQISLFGLVLSVGLQSSWSDFFHVLRRPMFLLRAILATNVIVPAVMIVLCMVLPIAPWTKVGLILMAASPVAPFTPAKMQKAGADQSYVVGTYVALVLAAVFFVPLTAFLLRPLGARGVPVAFVAWFIAKSVLLPLIVGISAQTYLKTLADRGAPIVRVASLHIILPVSVLILVKFAGQFPALIGDGTLAAIAATIGAALASGFFLGGHDPNNRKALGEAAATRHPGLAAAIAQLNANDSRVLEAIILFLFASIAFSAIYAWLLGRLTGPATPAIQSTA